MPISTSRFEALEEDGVTPETNADRILNFLVENQDQAFRLTEIEERTGIKRGSIGPTLSRLEERGLVDHRTKYWKISDNYVASKEAILHTSQAAAEYDDGEEFDVAAWAEKAEDVNAREYSE